MKKFNKVLAVALAVLMLAMTAVPASAAYGYWVDVIEDGDYLTISLEDGPVYYSFQPTVSGCYVVDTYIRPDCEYADPIIIVGTADGDIVSDDVYGSEAAACFYANAYEEYHIFFMDYNSEAVTYDVSVSNCCADFDYDGLCDGCGDSLCDCDCHEDGILGFFWSIKNFFNRLFRIDEQCDCGAWHW